MCASRAALLVLASFATSTINQRTQLWSVRQAVESVGPLAADSGVIRLIIENGLDGKSVLRTDLENDLRTQLWSARQVVESFGSLAANSEAILLIVENGLDGKSVLRTDLENDLRLQRSVAQRAAALIAASLNALPGQEMLSSAHGRQVFSAHMSRGCVHACMRSFDRSIVRSFVRSCMHASTTCAFRLCSFNFYVSQTSMPVILLRASMPMALSRQRHRPRIQPVRLDKRLQLTFHR